MEMFLVYLFMQSSTIINAAGVAAGLSFGAAVISILIHFMAKDDGATESTLKYWKSSYRTFMVIAVIGTILVTFFPARETIGAMYVIPKVIEYASESEIPKQVEEYIELFIQNEIKGLTDEQSEPK
jgi:hypothetical protein